MNKMQEQVTEFHRAFKLEIGEGIGFRKQAPSGHDERLLSKSLINEECRELTSALVRNDMVGIVDGACDLIYVVLGTMVRCGIDIEPYFNEVHRSNLEKQGGKMREDGKLLKPENWKPPQIAEMLKQRIGEIK